MCGSACFERFLAHHQELNNCSSSLWVYRWNVVIAVLLSDRPRPTSEADTAVVELLMMGVRTPEKC
jgi:hypothetical protein